MIIRRSEPRHREEINELTVASKAYWGYSDELMAMWDDGLRMTEAQMATVHAYHAEQDGEIVGMYVLDDPVTELLALFVAPAHIGTGVGAELFRHAADLARDHGATRLLVESDPHAVGFYEHMGCVVIGERNSIPEGRTLPLLELVLS